MIVGIIGDNMEKEENKDYKSCDNCKHNKGIIKGVCWDCCRAYDEEKDHWEERD